MTVWLIQLKVLLKINNNVRGSNFLRVYNYFNKMEKSVWNSNSQDMLNKNSTLI